MRAAKSPQFVGSDCANLFKSNVKIKYNSSQLQWFKIKTINLKLYQYKSLIFF